MHFKAPFVFIATTFVTAVLAIPISHGHHRRDAGQIASLFEQADAIVQFCTTSITNEQESGGSSGSLNIPTALESYAASIGTLGEWVTITPPLSESDSQTIMSANVLPYYQHILDNANTVNSVAQFVATTEGNVTVDATTNALKQINDNIKQFPAGMSLLFTADSLNLLDSINEQVQAAVTSALNTYEGLNLLSGFVQS